MLKILLKQLIIEECIETFFNKLYQNLKPVVIELVSIDRSKLKSAEGKDVNAYQQYYLHQYLKPELLPSHMIQPNPMFRKIANKYYP